MKIFASWSGKQSHAIAQALRDWLPNVLQAVDVFVSSQDIVSGDRGLNTIAESLAERGFGIVIVTKSNQNAPWVLFEAGALSNTLPGRVTPLLCDLPELALARSPLGQFQFNRFDGPGILKLTKDINKASASPIEENRLAATFDKWWPDLEQIYAAIPADHDEEERQAKPDAIANISAALAQLLSEQARLRHSQSEIKELLSLVVPARTVIDERIGEWLHLMRRAPDSPPDDEAHFSIGKSSSMTPPKPPSPPTLPTSGGNPPPLAARPGAPSSPRRSKY
ncbi:toll/interleukin-1 receptor domain-containing protein [Mesorhizobium australicum]|uniref:hypothetical protein n=1 Tax=Mesorhizobium TaxID=68287 RepID=UPI0012EBA89E|nr:hypothetical protein [Mesorhizobium sp. LNHC209A00]